MYLSSVNRMSFFVLGYPPVMQLPRRTNPFIHFSYFPRTFTLVSRLKYGQENPVMTEKPRRVDCLYRVISFFQHVAGSERIIGFGMLYVEARTRRVMWKNVIFGLTERTVSWLSNLRLSLLKYVGDNYVRE